MACGIYLLPARTNPMPRVCVAAAAPGGQPGLVHQSVCRLQLVDLAGSEDMNRSHAGRGDGAGIATNLGLHALTRCISALAAAQATSSSNQAGGGKATSQHIPYRDSTLTRLLQPALGV